MLTPLETSLIGLLLIVLMFGMGATLTAERFRDVAKQPKAFLILLASLVGISVTRNAGLFPLCFAILVTTFPGENQLEMLKLPLLYALFVLVEATLVTIVLRVLDARAEAAAVAPARSGNSMG